MLYPKRYTTDLIIAGVNTTLCAIVLLCSLILASCGTVLQSSTNRDACSQSNLDTYTRSLFICRWRHQYACSDNGLWESFID